MIDLPFELHISIARYLANSPRDLFSLLKISRSLHELYTSKTVWTITLREICIRDALFFPSYPVEEMSVKQLMRACLAPDLWNERIRTGPGLKDSGVQTLSSEPLESDPLEGAQRDSYNRVYFVPGGRYLIDHAGGRLRLWDLGLPSIFREEEANAQEPRIVTSILITDPSQVSDDEGGMELDTDGGGQATIEFVVCPSRDGMRLRVWVVPGPSTVKGGVSMSCTSSVYEIDLGSHQPDFTLMSSLTVLTPVWSVLWGDLSMRDDTAIFHSLDYIIVWDFCDSKAKAWRVRSRTDNTDMLFLSQASIYLVKSTGVLVWSIPLRSELKPIQNDQLDLRVPSAMPAPEPRHSYFYRQPEEGSNVEAASPYYPPLGRTLSHWYSGNDGFPALWDALEDWGMGKVGRYTLQQTNASTGGEVSRHNGAAGDALQARANKEDSPTRVPSLQHLEQAHLRQTNSFTLPGLRPNAYCLHRISSDMLSTLYNGTTPGWDFGLVYTPFDRGDSDLTPSPRRTSSAGASGGGLEEGITNPSANINEAANRCITGINLDKGFTGEFCSFTFCPASGRIAYSYVEDPDERGRGKGRVKVLDFWEGVTYKPRCEL